MLAAWQQPNKSAENDLLGRNQFATFSFHTKVYRPYGFFTCACRLQSRVAVCGKKTLKIRIRFLIFRAKALKTRVKFLSEYGIHCSVLRYQYLMYNRLHCICTTKICNIHIYIIMLYKMGAHTQLFPALKDNKIPAASTAHSAYIFPMPCHTYLKDV